MALEVWLIYLLAAVLLSLTPGPNGLLALTNGALYGLKKTLYMVAGGALGFTLVIALSMVGIGALLQASSNILLIMKWIGGAYLVWLGIQIWRSSPPDISVRPNVMSPSANKLFTTGFLAAVSNPKAILFFGAFLTQFIDPQRDIFIQFVIMAATFVVIETITEILIAVLAARVRHWLQRFGRRFNQVCGGMFAVIGISLPFSN